MDIEERLESFFNKHSPTLLEASLGNEEDEALILEDMLDEFAAEFPHCEVEVNTQSAELLIYDAIGEQTYMMNIVG